MSVRRGRCKRVLRTLQLHPPLVQSGRRDCWVQSRRGVTQLRLFDSRPRDRHFQREGAGQRNRRKPHRLHDQFTCGLEFGSAACGVLDCVAHKYMAPQSRGRAGAKTTATSRSRPPSSCPSRRAARPSTATGLNHPRARWVRATTHPTAQLRCR